MKLDTIDLPSNLFIKDEFDFKPVAQSVDRTISGGAVVESMALSYGAKITLTGAWAKRPVVQQLYALQANVSVKRSLTMNDNSTKTVLFDIEVGGLEAAAIYPESLPTDDSEYELTLNLIEVEPDSQE